MASLVLAGDTSGSITVSAPAVAGSNTQTLVATTGTLAPIVSATAQASTSGTSVDFTGIPSWVKRITVMLSGVSTNGTSGYLIQIGSGSVTTTGYAGSATNVVGVSPGTTSSTAGLLIQNSSGAPTTNFGRATVELLSGSTYVMSGLVGIGNAAGTSMSGAGVTLSGVLDRVRITTVNGTDTFDAGTINILYE